jgi:hypothetical protein
MKTFISTLCAAGILLVSSSAYAINAEKTCFKGDAKTVDEAFNLGVELAKKSGFELGDGEKNAHIHILPDKEHGIYIVKVCPSPCKEDKTET